MKLPVHDAIRLAFLIAAFCSEALPSAKAQAFEEATFGFPAVRWPSVAWGDYDGDGRLDILLAGMPTPSNRIAQIWHNTGSGFSNIDAGLPGVDTPTALWCDYDNDGRLDVLLTGNSDTGPLLQIWRNTGASFSNVHVALPAIAGFGAGSAAWGDFDNDGKVDLVLAGSTGPFTYIVQVWRNNGDGSFSNINVGFPATRLGVVKWIDYDNDGWLDILLLAQTGGSSSANVSELWRNTGSGFTNVDVGIASTLSHFSAAISDYDNDGWLDLLLPSSGSGISSFDLWHNSGKTFEHVNAGFPNMFGPFCAWGDYDNDGRTDILLTGYIGPTTVLRRTYLYKNTITGFTNVDTGLPGISSGSAAWGDYDNDGKLDLFLAGHHGDGSSVPLAQLWRNLTETTNSRPIAPSGLLAEVTAFGVKLRWDPGSDAETPVAGLSYNLRVGTTPAGFDIVSPLADSNGFRFLPQLGNRQMAHIAVVTNLLPGTYYWTVQTIDTGFAGSTFASEQMFVIPPAIVQVEFKRASNQLHLVCRGHPNSGYTIESSPDFEHWSDGRNLTAGVDGNFEETEDLVSSNDARFYRLREL